MQLGTIFREEEYTDAFNYVIENNYTIREIEPDDLGRRFQVVEIPAPTEQEKALNEIAQLKAWFAKTYTEKEQKYRRLHTLALACDDGSKPYTQLMNLYAEAETKRRRIQELEGVAHGSN